MEVVLVNDSGTPDPVSGQTGAREGALMDLTTELPALEDREAFARVLNRPPGAAWQDVSLPPGGETETALPEEDWQ